jgi:uncharacterized membrane protein YphA (DoxX/SURF4 family)
MTRPGGPVAQWLYGPQPIERLALLRILAPLVILGFMSTRLVHADYWIGDTGFSVPDLGGDWRQPLYLPPLPAALAWGLAALMILSGLATAAGLYTRLAAATFATTLLYVALADRLASFTVTKLSPVIALALCASAAGARYGVDAWRAARRAPAAAPPTHAPGGPVRFIQLLLPTFYCASGICKAKGDWLERSDVLWTHLHDSYQTVVSHWLANHLPASSWSVMQGATLLFEIGAPLWFALPWTRRLALVYGVALHTMIGLMFGPVKWFSLLMITLLLVAYLPHPWLQRLFGFRIGADPAGKDAPGDRAS